MSWQHHRRIFRSRKHTIVPAQTHSRRTTAGRAEPMITLEDRLAFRARVHLGDRVRFRDVGLVVSYADETKTKTGIIIGLYPNLVLVRSAAYLTCFTYDQIMLHDMICLVGDEDYIVREVS